MENSLLQPHEYSQMFPLMSGSDYEALRDDIRENGQYELITLFEGKILDGRNRYNACIDLQIEPRLVAFDGSSEEALEYALSKNLHRRQLTVAQRALVAASMSVLRKQKSESEGKPAALDVEQAAKLLGVSPRTVSSACKVVRDGSPGLQEAVKSGKVTISAAEHVAKLPQDEQQILCSKGANELRKKAKALREAEGGAPRKSQQKNSPSILEAAQEAEPEHEISAFDETYLPEITFERPGRAAAGIDHSPAMQLFELTITGGEEDLDLDGAVEEILNVASDEDIERLLLAAKVAEKIRTRLKGEQP